ncbi:MAG: hypothetical protein MUP76_11095 [Acidimicrobiia bacterium]|nr:hypothetical protein [Acidimicrobiia bacterium]
MPRAPLMIAALSVAAPLVWAAHLALDADPFAGAPSAVLAVGLAAASVVLGVALLIARARWARPMAVATALAGLGLAVVTPIDAGAVAGITLSGAALAGSLGPWLARWLRRLPSAEAPPRPAAVAVTAAALLPLAVAIARFDGFGGFDWGLCATAAIAAIAMLRARPVGLWVARLAVPSAGLAAGFAAGLPDGIFLAVAAVVASAPAWHRDVRLSIRPIVASTGNVAIPPELVDPGMLQAAGFDDRGRAVGSAS